MCNARLNWIKNSITLAAISGYWTQETGNNSNPDLTGLWLCDYELKVRQLSLNLKIQIGHETEFILDIIFIHD